MLATLTEERLSDPGWLFERELDGERCLAFRDGSDVRIRSRNRLGLRRDESAREVIREYPTG
jgi:ATP-dependent DNA ligase